MTHAQGMLTVLTEGQGLYEITADLGRWLDARYVEVGLLTLLCQHTSASLTIQENADPDVQYDLNIFFSRLVREDPNLYRHRAEGADDMPAHIRSALTGVNLSIPVNGGKLVLGTWQGVYLFEHRVHPHKRRIALQLIGPGSASDDGVGQ